MKNIFNITLKAKTIGLLIGSMIIMAISMTVIVTIQSKDVLLKKSNDALISAREVKANQIENFFKQKISDIDVLAVNANVSSVL